MKKKWIIGIGIIVVVGTLILVNLKAGRTGKTSVQAEVVERRTVTRVITASGNIQPRRRVNVSASALGKVTRLAVREGQRVTKGDFLLEIDATPYETAVDQLVAGVGAAEASLDVERAALKKAEYDHEKALELKSGDYVSENTLHDADIALEMARARARAVAENLAQQRASLERARHDLRQVRITADMSGVVTALNVEEGESAIMGTLNNPGTVLLTISDLSEMEAEVLVDETEVVDVKKGQPARVRLDAFPDTTFAGEVSEVGNSALRAQAGLGQQSVDFKVVVAIRDSIPSIRPGLSASVDITVAEKKDAVSVPIQSLTARTESLIHRRRPRDREQATAGDSVDAAGDAGATERKDIEGVWIVEDGVARFRRVRVGIAGRQYFVVEEGLSGRERVVTGPFRAIADLRDGDPVKVTREEDTKKKKSK